MGIGAVCAESGCFDRNRDHRLCATRVGTIRRVVCASPAYLKRRGRPRNLHALADHDAVNFIAPLGTDSWRFDGERDSAQPRTRLAVNTAEAAVDAAIAGIGMTRVLSYQAAAAITAGTLEVVLARHEPAALPVHLLHASRIHVPLKLRAFLDHATPRLRERLAG